MPEMGSSFAYISGPLTDVPDEVRTGLKGFYEKLGDVGKKHGLAAYIPHQHSDPVLHADLTPQEIYRLDHARVRLCSLLVAYVGVPSLGVGAEIAWAGQHQHPIILLAEITKLAERKISHLVLGVPSVVRIIGFTDFEDACLQLDAWFAANWRM